MHPLRQTLPAEGDWPAEAYQAILRERAAYQRRAEARRLADLASLRQRIEEITPPPEYPALVDPFPSGSPEAEALQSALTRLFAEDVPIPLRVSTKGDSEHRDIGTRRCSRPWTGVGVKASGGLRLALLPCKTCPGCLAFDRESDRIRITEAMSAPALGYVHRDRWDAVRKRFQRAGVPYFQVPLEDGRRAVIGEGLPIPSEPIVDLAETLGQLEEDRPARGGRRGPRASSSGLRSREEVEAEGRRVSEPVRLIGGFPSRGQDLTLGERLDLLEDELIQCGVPFERTGFEFDIPVGIHDPRVTRFLVRNGFQRFPNSIPWHEGGPSPSPGDPGYEVWESAVFPTVIEEPPIEVYERWVS